MISIIVLAAYTYHYCNGWSNIPQVNGFLMVMSSMKNYFFLAFHFLRKFTPELRSNFTQIYVNKLDFIVLLH